MSSQQNKINTYYLGMQSFKGSNFNGPLSGNYWHLARCSVAKFRWWVKIIA